MDVESFLHALNLTACRAIIVDMAYRCIAVDESKRPLGLSLNVSVTMISKRPVCELPLERLKKLRGRYLLR